MLLPLTVKVPLITPTSPVNVLVLANVKFPPLSCNVRPLGNDRLLMPCVPDPMTMVEPAVAMDTSSSDPGNMPPPQLAVLVQEIPSPKPVHRPVREIARLRPVPL